MANITGGGWVENIPRMLAAEDLAISADSKAAPVPEIFNLIQQWGNIDDFEMYSTFNMGIGFTLCVSQNEAEKVISKINETGEKAYIIGSVVPKNQGEKNIVIV